MDDLRRNSPGYEEDFAAWATEQARLMREGDFAGLDRENVAEELESLGRQNRHEIESRLAVLLMHLLKQLVQPDRTSRSWAGTIIEQRARIARLVEQSPSLRRHLWEMIAAEYQTARKQAAAETGRALKRIPKELPFTLEQVFDDELPRILPKR